MKKKVNDTLKALVFVLILILLLTGVSYLMMPRDNTEQQWKHDVSANAFRAEPEDTLDVLFFGDSEVYTNIMPLRIWSAEGITSYCVSSSKQNLWYTFQLMLDALQTQSPKIIFLEANAIFRYFTMDNFLLHGSELFFPVLKYHDRWKTISFSDLTAQTQYTYIHNEKGYHFSKDIDPADTTHYGAPTKKMKQVSMVNRLYVQAIKSLCDRYHVRLVLLSTPSTKSWNMSKHNSAESMAKALGVEYLDLNLLQEEVPIDWSHDTRDKGDHLNIYGANKVSVYLAHYLRDTGLFADHREDPTYSVWNKAVEAFVKKHAAARTFDWS